MMPSIEEEDLLAYVDDQLGIERRIEVERYLAGRPEAASRVMADLRTRNQLRLASAVRTDPPPRILRAASRLQGAFGLRRWPIYARHAAAAAIFLAAGWVAHDQLGSSIAGKGQQIAANYPSYVSEAVRAHRTAMLRTQIDSQRGQASYDRGEILAKTQIFVPNLPPGWQVSELQIFPAEEGYSIEIKLQHDDMDPISLFAVRAFNTAVVAPTAVKTAEDMTVYWQVGRQAYAMTGSGGSEIMARTGAILFESLQRDGEAERS